MNILDTAICLITGIGLFVIGFLCLFFTEKMITFFGKHSMERKNKSLVKPKWYQLSFKFSGFVSIVLGCLYIWFCIKKMH